MYLRSGHVVDGQSGRGRGRGQAPQTPLSGRSVKSGRSSVAESSKSRSSAKSARIEEVLMRHEQLRDADEALLKVHQLKAALRAAEREAEMKAIVAGVEEDDYELRSLRSEQSIRTQDWVRSSSSGESFLTIHEEANGNHFVPKVGQNVFAPVDGLIPSSTPVVAKGPPPEANRPNPQQNIAVSLPIEDIKGWFTRKQVSEELPTFEGDPAQWPFFFESFEESTVTGRYTDRENLLRLQKALKGEAKECVRALLTIPGGLPKVLDRLKRRFGKADTVVQTLMAKLEEVPSMGEIGVRGLERMASEVESTVVTIMKLNRSEYLFNPMILDMLVNKMNIYLQMEWGKQVEELGGGPISLEKFSDWIQKQADRIGNLNQKIQSTKEKIDLRVQQPTAEKKGKLSCWVCNMSNHRIADCRRFAALALPERQKKVQEQAACYMCLEKGHRGALCSSVKKCKLCEKRHHFLLHMDRRETVACHQENSQKSTSQPNPLGQYENEGDESQEVGKVDEPETSAVNVLEGGKIWLRVLPVILHGPKKTVQTFAFLDSGSTVTMMNQELAEELGLSGPAKPLRVSWSDSSVRDEEQSRAVTVRISGTQTEAKQFELNARTVKQLVLPIQSVDRGKLGIECKRLMELEIASFEKAQPTLLIGEDNWPLTVPLKVVHGSWHGPVATKTRLGWVVHGRVPIHMKGRVKEESELEEVHQMSHWEEDREEWEEKMLRNVLAEYMLKEEPQEEKSDVENERAREIFDKTTRKIEGRWETGLLWKNEDPVPRSYDTAFRRLMRLEKKMDADPAYGRRYVEKMEEGIAKGYITKLNDEDRQIAATREWFLPHLGVVNPNKPEKLRICFDASAKAGGVSLNEMLLTGPDLLVSIPGLLSRFREGAVAFSGDIKEMYPQIRIRKEDQMAQKFLWRGADRKSTPDTYVVRVMTFGAKCSPFSAQEVKNRNARECEGITPATLKAIEENHYMDDYLDCSPDEEQAIQRVHEVLQTHQQGGFLMCNRVSNSPKVIESIPTELRSAKGGNLEMGESEKLLGMWWCPKTDQFHFKVKFERIPKEVVIGERRPTKKEILKCVMTLYDPLGLIMAVIIEGKILLQEVWKTTPEWDKSVGVEQGREWDRWMQKLKALDSLKIPRPYSLGEALDVQLHVMCDASERAYAAVAYIRVVSCNGVSVELAYAKARVTKVKEQNNKADNTTIPRLELQAAVVASRAVKMLLQEHRIEFSRVMCWTDSRIVLGWIRLGGKMRLQAYINRRIKEIHDTCPPESWRWVPTKENCADDATRGAKKTKVEINERWFQGPQFLRHGEDRWPVEEDAVDDAQMEMAFVGIIQEKEWELLPDMSRFSQWTRMVRVTAKIPRIARYWRHKREEELEEITAEEIEEADQKLIKKAQQESFAEEIDTLRLQKPLPVGSRLKALDPFLDENGFLRVGGRLTAAEQMSFDSRHPLLLAAEHSYTRALLMKFHRWAKHQGQETILNALRQRFWITQARKAVKSSFNRCGLCQAKRAKQEFPKMAPLPRARVTQSYRPFMAVGLDYFGPIYITVGRRTEKRYVALFTCLAVRAVHLEIAVDLTSGSAIMAIRRFVARRGTPTEIYSDNGTNFCKANKELKEAIAEMNQDEVLRGLALVGIRWKFNCPAAPHMGGAWERMVRTVKTALGATVKEERPREDVLATLLAEVEMIVNSRPLTHVSVDPSDLTCLTPNHFLIGEANAGPSVCLPVPANITMRVMWKRAQQMADTFWRRWVGEYVTTLTQRSKWTVQVDPLKVGDLVVIADEGYARGRWPRGVITAVETAKDGQVRSAYVKTAHGTCKRPAAKIAKLSIEK